MATYPINMKDRYAMGWSDPMTLNMGAFQPVPEVYRVDNEVRKMTAYAEMCGDSVEFVEVPEGEVCDDVKVILLKASKPEQYIKDVGIKISESKFAVYREEGEALWSK